MPSGRREGFELSFDITGMMAFGMICAVYGFSTPSDTAVIGGLIASAAPRRVNSTTLFTVLMSGSAHRIGPRPYISPDVTDARAGEVVSYDDIAKGYETEDGEMVVLTDEDFKDLPASSSKDGKASRDDFFMWIP